MSLTRKEILFAVANEIPFQYQYSANAKWQNYHFPDSGNNVDETELNLEYLMEYNTRYTPKKVNKNFVHIKEQFLEISEISNKNNIKVELLEVFAVHDNYYDFWKTFELDYEIVSKEVEE